MTESSSYRSIRIEESAVGSAIVSGDGNTIYVIHQTTEQRSIQAPSETPTKIGPNPYKGLAAFKESDADRYFGREVQVERLWQRFHDLYEQSAVPRFLPIIGPSGCGKSSLVRAGLLPELARRPLLEKESMQVVVMFPGESPFKSLAGVLARLTRDDETPEVIKKRSYEEELRRSAESGRFDFLQDVAETLPDIQASPMVVLVDQFEEIYSNCKDFKERIAFIENLLHAARSSTGYVTIMITLSSDFLGETQRHKQLNQVIGSDQSIIVPAMTTEELRRAIAEPAKHAGHPIDDATVELLVKDTEGREGALPLLQFALIRIWEGLTKGKASSETYRQIGGVGGALADKAQQIYDKLTEPEQKVAQRVFIGLVQLGEGTRDTRRRVTINTLIAKRDTPDIVQQVIRRFSSPGARLITLSSLDGQEIAEVTHEALFEHWQQLKQWLDDSRDDLRFRRRLEAASNDWDETKRPEGKLWRPPDLDLLRRYYESSSNEMTSLQMEFLTASINAIEKIELEKSKHRRLLVSIISMGTVAILTAGIFAWQQWQGRQINELLALTTGDIVKPELIPAAERLVAKADRLSQSTQPTDIDAALSYYRAVIGFCQALTTTANLEAPVKVDDLRTLAEAGLVNLISMKKLGVLETQLTTNPPQIGDRTGAQRTDFNNQFSEGALQTTYAILRRQEGAKADIYDSGQISTYKEAERMPCQLLEEIERIWREYTQNTCGWYSKEGNHAFFDLNCDALGGETLTAKVFNDPYDAAIERLQICELVPEGVDLDYPFQDF